MRGPRLRLRLHRIVGLLKSKVIPSKKSPEDLDSIQGFNLGRECQIILENPLESPAGQSTRP